MNEVDFSEGFATQAATRRHWQVMLTVVGIATLASAAGLYWPTLQLPEIPAIVPAGSICVTITDLLTSYLLFIQFTQIRRAPQALLGAVYLFSGLIVWPYVLCFPGVITEQGLFGAGPQSAVWLWVFWHFGFLLFMICFIFGGGLEEGRQLSPSAASRLSWVTGTTPLALVAALTILATRGQDLLPALVSETPSGKLVRMVRNYGGVDHSIFGTAGILAGLAIVITVPVMTRCRRLVDLGLAVAIYASLLDTILNVAGSSRYTLAWYLSRTNSLLSSGAVLAIYLKEITRLYLKAHEINRALASRTAELEAAKEGAEAATRSKSAFLAMMSHEIRTPINAILGLTHLLGSKELDEEGRDFLVRIDGAGRSLLSVVNDVLDFSRVEAGRLELDHAPFDLSEVLDRVADTMSMTARSEDVELLITTDAGVPRRLEGDTYRLQQILGNLVGNAIKFTESGEICLRVAVAEASSNHAVLSFTVTDTGIGIPAEKLPSLFEAFAQGDASTTRRYGGSGLGLTIAKRLVDMMGGSIGATSREGQGSTFWVAIPFTIAPSPDGQPATSVFEVLIVDASAAAREALTAAVASLGWRAECVPSCRAALACIEARLNAGNPFDVVLLDWRSDEADELAALESVRQLRRGTQPQIIVTATAFSREKVVAALERKQLDGLLTKPVTAGSLADLVHKIRLPRPDAAPTEPKPGGMVAALLELRGIRVLLVEDNAVNQLIARRILEHHGAVVDLANEGRQAVERLRADPHRWHVVLMDVQMPVMDGYEATRAIRQELGLVTLPIIALTAGVLASERERALGTGMTDFLGKPLAVAEMIAMILRHLRDIVRTEEEKEGCESPPD